MTKFTNTFWWRQQTVVALFAYYFRQESLLQVGVSTVQRIKFLVYNQQYVKCGYWSKPERNDAECLQKTSPHPTPACHSKGGYKSCAAALKLTLQYLRDTCAALQQILTACIFVGFSVLQGW